MARDVARAGSLLASLVIAFSLACLPAVAAPQATSTATAVPTTLSSSPSPAVSPPVPVEPLRIGQRWRGRLRAVGDEARLGFTLRTAEHLSLHLAQPKDADGEVRLMSGGRELLRQRALKPGVTLVMDLWLTAGDHALTLRSTRPTDARYRLLLWRQDPFVVPADTEPNDAPDLARDVPASLRWHGAPAGAEPDLDGYWLPALSMPGDIRIAVTGERPRMRLYADTERAEEVALTEPEAGAGADPETEDDVLVARSAPVGRPLYLEVEAEGPYGIELDAPGWQPAEDALTPPVEVELKLVVPEGFTCQATGASLPLDVTIVNVGAEPLEIELRSASSAPAWRLTPDADVVSVSSGESVVIPGNVAILPGGCSHEDTALSVAAVAADGGLVSTMLTLDPRALAPGQVLEAPERASF
jgi:hypothetical protein